jgi:hypothetical protein
MRAPTLAGLSPARTFAALALVALSPVACDCDPEPISSFVCDFEVTPSGSGNEIRFNATAVGASAERSWRVTNTGTGVTLDRLTTTFETVNGAHYRADIPEGTRITTGDDETFLVVFAPLVEAELASRFVVSHPDVGNAACPSVTVFVRGRGFRPQDVDAGPDEDAGPEDGGPPPEDAGPDGGVVITPDGGVLIPPGAEWFAYGALEEARAGFQAVALRDGTGDVLVVGGFGEEGEAVDSIERLNPSTGIARVVGRMAVPRAEPALATLPDGKVVILGGRSAAVAGFALRTIEVFDPINGDTLTCPDPAGCLQNQGVLDTGRIGAFASATSQNQIVIVLGRTLDPNLAEVPVAEGELVTLTPLSSQPLPGAAALTARIGAAQLVDPGTGNFLLVGGRSAGGAVLTDVLRVTAGGVTSLGNLAFPRAFSSVALLGDGRAMVAGGFAGTGLGVRDVELITAPFGAASIAAAGLQLTPRIGGSLLALEGDIVLWAGGASRRVDNLGVENSELPRTSADLVIPFGTSSFLRVSPDNDLAHGRFDHQALAVGLGGDQRKTVALFIGGTNTAPRRTPHPHVERYLLDENRFLGFGLMGPGTALEAGVVAGSGAALVSAGGTDPHTGRTSSAVRAFDAITGTYVEAGELREPRRDHTITRFAVTEGQALLVAGGRDESGTVLSSLTIFDPVNRVDRRLPVSLRTPRANHTATRLADGNPIADGAVLLCGGVGQGGAALDSCEVVVPPSNPLDPTTFDDPSEVPVIQVLGRLSTGRVAHTATLLDTGEVILIGGGDPAVDRVAADVFVPDASAPFVRPSGGQPVQARRGHAAAFIGSGRILVVGGEVFDGAIGATRTAELYVHAVESFVALAEMEEERAAPALFLLGDGNVLVAGGARNNGTPGVPTRSNITSELYVVRGDGTGTFEELPDMPLSFGRSDVLFVDVFGRAMLAGGTHRDGVVSTGDERRTPITFVDFLQAPEEARGPRDLP